MSIKRLLMASALVVALGTGGAEAAGDPEECETVRFSDVGWSCITATTAIATTLLEAIGYDTETNIYSVPITFQGLADGEIDAFLGLWLPSQKSMIQKYFDKGQIDRVAANLEGAKYTLAVPAYVKEAGVENFADLDAHKEKFGGKVYGIEPGNDGNQIIQTMIDKNEFGLGDWELVESSEAGMLTHVRASIKRDEWVVFLGWEPHPMNQKFDMGYLAGGDNYFGPNYGGATVYTLTPSGYTEKCPNVGRFLKNVKFTLGFENEVMDYMLNDGMEPQDAAEKLMRNHPGKIKQWLSGVSTFDGSKEAWPAVKAELGL